MWLLAIFFLFFTLHAQLQSFHSHDRINTIIIFIIKPFSFFRSAPPFLHFPGPPPLEPSPATADAEEDPHAAATARRRHEESAEGSARAAEEEVIGSDCLYGEEEVNMMRTSFNSSRNIRYSDILRCGNISIIHLFPHILPHSLASLPFAITCDGNIRTEVYLCLR